VAWAKLAQIGDLGQCRAALNSDLSALSVQLEPKAPN
jgi:hypothetical protein